MFKSAGCMQFVFYSSAEWLYCMSGGMDGLSDETTAGDGNSLDTSLGFTLLVL
jgi:hypothetical protein